MKKNIILWLLLGVHSICYSQIVIVKDIESEEAIEMASLTSDDPNVHIYTNSKGQADITAFTRSEKIIISAFGYETATKSYKELEQTNFTVPLTPSVLTVDEIVISATRWGQLKRDVPSKIISITPKDVALQNPQTMADLLSTSGQVFIQKSQQGGGSPMIRGFSTNRLLYIVDGVRMNTAIFRSGNLQNVISLDPFSTGKTEVFFGPGSVIYGSDAIGGVMSFQTLTPYYSLTGKPLVTGKGLARFSSANNEQTGHFDFSLGWEKVAMVTSFSHFNFGDLRMGTKGPEEYLRPFYVQRQDSVDVVVTNDNPLIQRPTGYSQINLMQKFAFRPMEKLNIEYGLHYSKTSDYSRYDRHIRYRNNGLPRSTEWYYGPQVWIMNNLSITHSGKNALYDELAIRAAYQFFEESRIDRDMNDAERRRRIEKVDAYSLNFDFHKSFKARHTLYYGLEAVYDKVLSRGIDEDITTGTTVTGPARYPQSSWQSYGAYLSYLFKLTEKINLQAGARYNQFILKSTFDTTFYPFPFTKADINNGALTGNVGAVYHPTEKWSLSASLSTGFRSPNVDDVGKVFDSEPGSVVVPNPNLKAEYVYNAEVGLAKVFGNNVKIDFAAYYSLLDDALVRRDFTLNGQDSIVYDGQLSQVQAIQNAAIARIYGIQAGLEIKFPLGFEFSSHFNYQKGEEELDDGTISPSRHVAPWFGVSHLIYSYQKLKWDLYVIYNGEVSYENLSEEGKGTPYLYATNADGNPYSPGWYTLNFKAMYHFNDTISLSSGVENITDQRYRPYSSGIAGAGRNFILSLMAHF